jgi:hypothetical protein
VARAARREPVTGAAAARPRAGGAAGLPAPLDEVQHERLAAAGDLPALPLAALVVLERETDGGGDDDQGGEEEVQGETCSFAASESGTTVLAGGDPFGWEMAEGAKSNVALDV